MENLSTLKGGKSFLRQLSFPAGSLSLSRIFTGILCLILARAGFFEVLRPFAPAFYAASGLSGVSRVPALIGLLVGNLCFASPYEAARQVLSVIFYELFLNLSQRKWGKRQNLYIRGIAMALAMGTAGIVKGLVQSIRLYDVIASLLTALLVFALAILMGPSCEALTGKIRAMGPLDSKVRLSRVVIACGLVASVTGLTVWGLSLNAILAGIFVLVAARGAGSAYGACAGAVMGSVLALYELPGGLALPGLFALAGTASGVKTRSRVAPFTLWCLVTLMFAGLSILEGGQLPKYYEALVSGIVFLIIPSGFIRKYGDFAAKCSDAGPYAEKKERESTKEAGDRLYLLGKALARIAGSMEDFLQEEAEDEGSLAEWVVESVAERVCNRCSMRDRCWNTHFVKTYKLVEKAVSELKTDETGQLELPPWFKSSCVKPDKFRESLWMAFSLYKTDSLWRQKLAQSRTLLARQGGVMARSILKEARRLSEIHTFDQEMEERLYGEAAAAGESSLEFRCRGGSVEKAVLEVVSENTARTDFKLLDDLVIRASAGSLIRFGSPRRDICGRSVIRYRKKARYKTATGVARVAKDGAAVSGDNFTFFATQENLHITAISDGAGSGRRAERYSRTTIQMLESLLEEGLEYGLALKFLSLYLKFRGDYERMATLDVCAVDLDTGTLSWSKTGAVAAFIKRSSGVTVLPGDSLKEMTEALEDAESLLEEKPSTGALSSGDFIVMISDGVLEAFADENGTHSIQHFIGETDTVNAQFLADAVLQEALKRAKNGHDDMTVLVTKLW